ncbi:Crp/Fnr family transcriptional regulator [Streptomyces sp. NPDC054794]
MASPAPKVDAFHPAEVLTGRQPMPEGSFLDYLPASTWSMFVQEWGLDARTYAQGQHLPLGTDGRMVQIVLGGCVVQERFPFGTGKGAPTVVRFRGVGQLLGEAKLIDPASAVRTVCLSTTWAMPCPIDSMNVLLKRNRRIQLALLRSLEARNRSDEMIYCTADRSPLERVGTLLLHLAQVAGTKDPGDPGRVTIMGPRQTDLARALLLGKSTVENVVAGLRRKRVLDCKYRQLVVTDIPRLNKIVSPA